MILPTQNERAQPVTSRLGSSDSATKLISPSIPEDRLSVIDLSGYVHDPVLGDVTVRVHEYGHLVICHPRLFQRYHHVFDCVCNCHMGPACPGVRVVAQYLGDGGQMAPTPPEGYFPYTPWTCPVCGERAARADQFSSRRRGQGWICTAHGESHYWTHHSLVVRNCRAL